MSGPPDWLAWALAASLTAIPVLLIVAAVSALIDLHGRTATEATQPERTRT